MSEPKRLSEKDVAEIRHGGIGHTREFYAHGTSAENCALRNANYLEKLLADRDAHLADLRRLMQVSRPHVPRGIKQVYIEGDAFLERTK